MTFVPEEEREKAVVSRYVPTEGPWEKGVPSKGWRHSWSAQLEGRAAGDDMGKRERQQGLIRL